MRNAVMLIHDGGWSDIYLDLCTFFGNVGIFVYDNRDISREKVENFKGISTFIYLLSDGRTLRKFRSLDSLPQTAGIVLSGKLQGKLSDLAPSIKSAQAKVICSDNKEEIAEFVLRLFSMGDHGRYKTLTSLYGIFMQNQLVQAYYCAQYMNLPLEEWKPVLIKIARGVQKFEQVRDLPNPEYVLFASGLGMKRANDICRKIFNQTQTKWSVLTERQVLLFEERKILQRLESAYRLDPDMKLALMFLNDVTQRNYPSLEHALTAFKTCLGEPMFYYVYYKWGLLLQRLKDPEAEAMFLRSISINPCCYRSQYRLGLIYEKREEYEEAQKHYRQIIKTLCRPKTAHPIEFEYLYKAFYRLGVVQTEMGQLRSALSQCKKADWLWNTLEQNTFLQHFYKGIVKNPVAAIRNRIRKNVLDTNISILQAAIQKGENDEEKGSTFTTGLVLQNQV